MEESKNKKKQKKKSNMPKLRAKKLPNYLLERSSGAARGTQGSKWLDSGEGPDGTAGNNDSGWKFESEVLA